MESLSRCLSAFPQFLTISKIAPNPHISQIPIFKYPSFNSHQSHSASPTTETQTPKLTISTTSSFFNDFHKELSFLNSRKILQKSQFSFLFLGMSLPLSCLASDITTTVPVEEESGKINLESILVSIDNFFTKYPFFVATVAFIWLVVIPLTEEYLQKYKFISAINAFNKLKDDPNSQLLDIRDNKSLAYLASPNLKILNKSAFKVEFREGDEDGFVKRVLENLGDPANTTVCVLDNFDGKSIKVAELLVKNGFKEAYAVRGGIRGQKGWQDIQESLLPLSVHVYPKESTKKAKHVDINGGMQQQSGNGEDLFLNTSSSASNSTKEVNDKDFNSISPTNQSKCDPRSSSPYPNYPDYKPPSSPTPSKPS